MAAGLDRRRPPEANIAKLGKSSYGQYLRRLLVGASRSRAPWTTGSRRRPRISVITPLYNCLALTQAMVASLRRSMPPVGQLRDHPRRRRQHRRDPRVAGQARRAVPGRPQRAQPGLRRRDQPRRGRRAGARSSPSSTTTSSSAAGWLRPMMSALTAPRPARRPRRQRPAERLVARGRPRGDPGQPEGQARARPRAARHRLPRLPPRPERVRRHGRLRARAGRDVAAARRLRRGATSTGARTSTFACAPARRGS